MAMLLSSFLWYSSGPVLPSLETLPRISAASSISKTESMPSHLLPWEPVFLVPKWFLWVFQFFCNLWSLSYTLSFIWYILRMSHNLFLPYTLSFISYILRIYSYRILYLLYRIFKNFFLSWFSFRKKHWSWKLTILHFPPAMAIGYITFIKT